MTALFSKPSKQGSALLIGIFVTMIIIIIAIYLLEKIIPFSRDIKGVESGNISYYRANTALNEALLSLSGSDPSIGGSSGTLMNGSGILYQITSTGTLLPKAGLGNSEYDADWSTIAPGKPVQLVLANGLQWNSAPDTYFTFRIPDLNQDGDWTNQTLSGSTISPIINWSLSASGDTLQASGSYLSGSFVGGSHIMATDIYSGSTIYFGGKNGLTLSGSSETFGSFYTAHCTGTEKCTLKLSVVNPLLLNDNTTLAPYVEYQAHFNAPVPLQTAIIETQGYIAGFRKNITRFVQQMTTNEALDFTVFQ